MVLVISRSLSASLGDSLRIVTALELLVVLGLACAILGVYFVGNLHIRRVSDDRRGLLPRYVVAMALSYALLVAFGIAELEGYYGTGLTWRAPIGFVAANLGIYATVSLLLFENTRLDLRDSQVVHLEGTPEGDQ